MHLKMSGSLLLKPDSAPEEKFTRAVFHLDNGINIVFRDPRKFGVVWLVEDSDSIVSKLGPEPLNAAFTVEMLSKLLAKRKAPIKPLLLDQTFIAGIGNMYADEALYEARIHPLRPANSLAREEIERLYDAIENVLSSAIGNQGASIENYIRPDGTPGTAHFQFRVAHQRNKTCPVCGGPIERMPVRNRGTYFCPVCQT
jgi:formamidopyrimidine-DNA glycosylase